MTWAPEDVLADFATVARLAGVSLKPGDMRVEELPAPHAPPTRLPGGHMAVYVFSLGAEVLKVGKVGPKSQARYTSQHYNPGSAMSTLAASILADRSRHALSDADAETIGEWIRAKMGSFAGGGGILR